ncbi:MinD/ParA family protein [Bacillus xiapuensis]|uniref:MinD/ParA family protein n=1 Tax=Bacillus xiapuensis TaxID=2014075 RepID=UPI000C237C47|nr:MinD/ParA family protein [Bacillus xiapuensis]
MSYDQAEGLRQKLHQLRGDTAKTIAVVSGKGGVGKSNISMNFALDLTRHGKKVLIFDMDIGMGNLHVLTGQTADGTIVDFFEKNTPLEELIVTGPEGVAYILGSSGLGRLMEWNEHRFERWISSIERLQHHYDYLLFDMGAGATKETLDIAMAAEDVFVITTPEPTSVTDAYSMIKYMHLHGGNEHFYLIGNRVETKEEGLDTLSRLQRAVSRFLQIETELLGVLPEDHTVRKAVTNQVPFLLSFPYAPVSIALQKAARKYMTGSFGEPATQEPEGFIRKLRHFFLKGRG